MAAEHLQILGLAPGRHDPRVLAERFEALRAEALAMLARPETGERGAARLDALHWAYRAACRDANVGARSDVNRHGDASAELQAIIAASLEDGLLRYSRRQQIIEAGRARGFSDFQTQLLIAHTQYCDAGQYDEAPRSIAAPPRRPVWPFVAASALLAVAMFLMQVWWVG